MNNIKEQKDILEKFVLDSSLKELESRFNKFNIFDCLKLTRTEIRHSNFIAWLLDPKETHGLNDYFLKEFIKNVISENKTRINKINGKEYLFENEKETYTIPDVMDIDTWDMSSAEVLREKEYIDLLIIDEYNKFVVVIENKIDSSQHDNQLLRYREYVDNQYPNSIYKKLYIYLRPKREFVEEPYIYTNYELVKHCLLNVLKNIQINEEVRIIINHYVQIIERDIMQNENVGKICAQIYKKHKKAIDLINRYSNIPRDEIFDMVEAIIKRSNLFSYCTFDKDSNHIVCLPQNINNIEKFKFGINSNESIINIHFWNFRYGKDLYFEIGIDAAINDVGKVKRKELITHIEKNIKNIKFNNTEKWAYSKPRFVLLSENDYFENDCDIEQITCLAEKRLKDILATKINEIANVLNSWKS